MPDHAARTQKLAGRGSNDCGQQMIQQSIVPERKRTGSEQTFQHVILLRQQLKKRMAPPVGLPLAPQGPPRKLR